MTNFPSPDQEPEPRESRSPHRRRRLWIRIGLVGGGILLVGGAGAAWWAWRFIQTDLSPTIANALEKSLNRQVEVGPLQQFSLNQVTFGESQVYPTDDDPGSATVEAVRVNFNLLNLLSPEPFPLLVTLVQPDVFLARDGEGRILLPQFEQQDDDGGGGFKVEPTIRVEDGTLKLATFTRPAASADVAERRQQAEAIDQEEQAPQDLPNAQPPAVVVFNDINGYVAFSDENSHLTYDISTQMEFGGALEIAGEANTETDDVFLDIEATDLLAPDLNLLADLPVELNTGRISADLEVRLSPDYEFPRLYGTGRFENLNAQVPNVPQPILNAEGRVRLDGEIINILSASGLYGQIPVAAKGQVNLQEGYDLQARVAPVTVETVLNTLDTTVPIPLEGTLQAEAEVTGALNSPNVSAVVTNTEPVLIDRVTLRQVRAEAQYANQSLNLESVSASLASGGTVVGNGRIQLGEPGNVAINLQAQNVPGDAIAQLYGANLPNNIRIGRVDADARIAGALSAITTAVNWRAAGGTYPGQGQILIAGEQIQFRDTVLQVANGTVRGQGQISNGQLQATLTANGVEVSQFAPQVQGPLDGTVRLSAPLENFSIAALRAEGNAQLAGGVSGFNRPITTAFRWLGDRLQIDRLTAPGLDVRGTVFARVEGAGAPAISRLDLNANVQNFNLAELPVNLPDQLQLAGNVDFSGQIAGALDSLSVAGRLGLNQFAVNDFAFEPSLSGPVRFGLNQGGTIDLTGNRDRIYAQIDSNYRPREFFLQRDETIARGEATGDRLDAQLRNFPLSALNLAPAQEFGIGRLTGTLNGDFTANLADLSNPSVAGGVAVANPALGYINADTFTAQFVYADGAAVLRQGRLIRGGSEFLIAGSYQPQADPQLQANVQIEEGYIQDVLALLQWFELSDIARGFAEPDYVAAGAVQPIPVTAPEGNLLNQLQRYSEILALRQQQATEDTSAIALPPLSELQGQFSGAIDVAFSPSSGPTIDFGLQGQDWDWGPYHYGTLVAEGSFSDGTLSLLPLRVATDDSSVAFSGQVGANQSGQLLAENVSVASLADLLNSPVNVAGNLDATVTLAGSIENPQVLGELDWQQASINGDPIEGGRGLFGYNDARLNFNTRVVVDNPDNPLVASGSIPYAFPFMTVTPDSNQLIVDVEVQDDGLKLIDVFSNNQLAWLGGSGEIDATIRGTLDQTEDGINLQPLIDGVATFDDAAIATQVLAEPLTSLDGTVLFNADEVTVQSLEGEFSSGQVTAQGTIPIFARAATNETDLGLMINLDSVALDYQELFEGTVDGEVLIAGAILAPVIGGDIALSDSEITLGNNQQTVEGGSGEAPEAAENGVLETPQFDDLAINLGENLEISSGILFNFIASGNLLINGSLDDLAPSGVVQLNRGRVSLYSTQFNLQRGYDNTATFVPERGLDPIIDVQMVAYVPEFTGIPVNNVSSLNPAETNAVTAANIGQIDSIRVEANVQGPASQIQREIELTSTPYRTEQELVGLLGGNVISNLSIERALLVGVQNFISNTLGLSDFRIYPTQLNSDEEAGGETVLAAELGLDVTNDFSLFVSPILTTDAPVRFGVRYELSDQFLLRGSTNLTNNSSVILEYRTRF